MHADVRYRVNAAVDPVVDGDADAPVGKGDGRAEPLAQPVDLSSVLPDPDAGLVGVPEGGVFRAPPRAGDGAVARGAELEPAGDALEVLAGVCVEPRAGRIRDVDGDEARVIEEVAGHEGRYLPILQRRDRERARERRVLVLSEGIGHLGSFLGSGRRGRRVSAG